MALGVVAVPAFRAGAQQVGAVMAALSAYMVAAGQRPLPDAVLEQAKYHILDTFAAMLSGSQLRPGLDARKFAAAQTGGGVATVVGSKILLGPIEAAFVNGMLAHSDETDDSHGESQSHPGAAVVPAAFAMAERLSASGEQLLRAVTLGYDVGPRLTMALGGMDFRNDTRRSTHAFAGTFGAAAAAGSLAKLDERQTRWLLDYASQQAAGYAIWGRDTAHVEKAFVFGGMPARAGVTAAEVVRAGWSGVDDVFSGEDNFFRVNAPAGKPELLIAALGERYEIANTDIKKWTVGTPIQGPLDALESLMRQHRFDANDVAEVVVRLAPAVGSVVDNRDIPDICLQHMLAIMLLYRTVSFNMAHDEVRMKDPVVLRERSKVRYVADAELTKALPVRVAIVEVTLRNGMRHSERVDAVRGTPRNPMSRDEVVAKARDLIAPVLHDGRTDTLIGKLLALETLGDVRDLRPLLRN